jgi:hypothetical protein
MMMRAPILLKRSAPCQSEQPGSMPGFFMPRCTP